jgi:Tfp pilus assembly protein PilX
MHMQAIRNERGLALFLVLLLMVVVASLATGAIMLSGNASLIGRFHAKEAEMRASADAGLEWARDTLNGTPGLAPVLGFSTLQDSQPVRDALGATIPGYTRSIFVGRSGGTTNQFGVYASVISRIVDNAGRAVVVRRAELSQQSFAQFARFDDVTLSSVTFARGIQVFGPIHTNGVMYVGSTPPTPIFHGPATTASTINAVANGDWRAGWKENVARINMPTPADLATLSGYAAAGNLTVVGGALGTTVYNP